MRLSDVEQSLDVVDGLDTAHLFNCRRHLSMLKGVREKTGDFHPIRQEILRLACPRLLDFPIPEEPGPLHHQSKMPHLCRIMGRMRHTILSYLYCLGWRGTLRLLADERIKRPLANRSEKRARGTQFCGMKSAVDAIKAEDGSRASPLIFTCAGDVADIIYSLPVCREMAGKLGHATFRYNVDPRIGRRTATASPCERRSILRLLEHVPYISEVTFSAQLPPYVIDIGRTFPRVAFGFSRNGGSRRSWFLHDGTCIMPDFSRPWLKKEMTLVVPRKVILHCSGRSVASRLDLSSLAKYKDEIVFWGTSEEHNAFCGKFFDVEFKQISSYTDLASWVANARFVIDTGSELFALAESMKVPRLLIAANSSRLNGLQDSSCQHLTNARDAEIVVGEFFKRYCDDVETQVAVGGAEPSVHSYDAWNSIKSAAKANAHVIIPVYGNAPMLVSCVASVLEYTPENVPIMLIDDASPDADIVTSMGKLKTMAPDRITVVRNPANMGFVRTCNKAMQLAGNADVVLLNSDTIVSPRWFVNLRIAAYSSARAGTATAISNKAYFCSVPECYSYNSRHTNEIPAGHSVASVGRMFLQSNEIWYDFLAGTVSACI